MSWRPALQSLEIIKSKAAELGVSEISSIVLEDSRFPIWSGSSKSGQHHYGTGGLIEHTLEVIELCLINNAYFDKLKQADPVKLFLAALFHDVGKMWDYRINILSKEWEGAPHKRNIHHIARSAIVWSSAAEKFKFEDSDEVLHAILAHHQLREWGSPVSPNSKIAWLLHLCDGISARVEDCDYMTYVR